MFDGTSMAAPIITGTIALMKTIKPDINVKQCIAVIQKTGKKLDEFIPPMVLVDQALIAVRNGDIPDEPIWSQILDTGFIEHDGNNDSTDQSQSCEQNSTESNNPIDDYSALKDLLKQLKEQRDALNKKISDIEKKIQYYGYKLLFLERDTKILVGTYHRLCCFDIYQLCYIYG